MGEYIKYGMHGKAWYNIVSVVKYGKNGKYGKCGKVFQNIAKYS